MADTAPPSTTSRPWTLWPVLLSVALVALATLPAGVFLVALGVARINLIPILIALPLLGVGWSVIQFGIRTFRRSTEATEALVGLYAALAVVSLVAFFFTDGTRGSIAVASLALFVLSTVFALLHVLMLFSPMRIFLPLALVTLALGVILATASVTSWRPWMLLPSGGSTSSGRTRLLSSVVTRSRSSVVGSARHHDGRVDLQCHQSPRSRPLRP